MSCSPPHSLSAFEYAEYHGLVALHGHRVPHHRHRRPSRPRKEQRAFEKGLFQKTKKAGGDIILYDSHLAVYKHSLDLIFYIIGDPTENELMLNAALVAFSDAVMLLLRNQVEKRGVLENLDLVLLCLDETIDDGIIVETDSTTIASRVSRPRADTTR
ncbi:Longin-like domain-containing protein [Cerioporus squamosus]|nr:Longin-like domain-containing protein [Cerioporus squamosus]